MKNVLVKNNLNRKRLGECREILWDIVSTRYNEILLVFDLKTRGRVIFSITLKNLSLVRIWSWNFLSKPLWRSIFLFKLESYSLQYCKRNCHKLYFLCILRTYNSENHVSTATFPWSYSYKKSVTDTKKWNNYFKLRKIS